MIYRLTGILKNIREHIVRLGNVAILTSTFHLPFFEEKIPEGIFLL